MDRTETEKRGGALLLTIVCAALAVLLLRSSKTVGDGVRAGLRLCGDVVIPSLFPFLVLSGFAASSRVSGVLARALRPVTRYVFRLPASGASPLLMGMIGGYPVGARTLAVMVREGRIGAKTAGRMLCYCANAGPPFLLSAVGLGMFGSLRLGGLLLAAQAASAVVIGAALGLLSRGGGADDAPREPAYRPYSVCFVQAVNDACAGMFSICAFVVLFSAVTSLVKASGAAAALAAFLGARFPGADARLAEGILFGLLEVTTGCSVLGGCGRAGLPAAAALLSFSGLSVVFQVLAAIHGSGIPARGFLLSRLFHAALTLGIFLALLRLFPQAVEAALSFTRPVATSTGTAGGSASLIAMCAVFLLTCKRPAVRRKSRVTSHE